MKKQHGFTSFEFYLAVIIIGVIVLVGIQRYFRLAEQTQRLSFEIVAQHFSASVYSLHAQWILARQKQAQADLVLVDSVAIEFTPEGWPLAAAAEISTDQLVSVRGCLALWQTLLQNPPAISFEGGDAYGSRAYHLSLTPDAKCHFEFISDHPNDYYFDYSPQTGQVAMHSPPVAAK